MTQSTDLRKAEALIAQREAVYAARENAKAIVAAGKRFGATSAEVDEAIRSGTDAAEFARHHEIEMLAGQIAAM